MTATARIIDSSKWTPAQKAAERRIVARAYEAERAIDKDHLMASLRGNEIERTCQDRYGGPILPDDDDGRDWLEIAAHHLAHGRGNVIARIVAWARRRTPWLPRAEAMALAKRIAAAPLKFTADTLAWRIGLTMAERTRLGIKTIGAIDCPKAARLELRNEKDREYQRARRAARRSGKPRGRPTKNASAIGDSIIADGFSADGSSGAARGTMQVEPGGTTSKERILSDLSLSPETNLPDPRADHPQKDQRPVMLPTVPPPEVIARAIEVARRYGIYRDEAVRQLNRMWPRHVAAHAASLRRRTEAELEKKPWIIPPGLPGMFETWARDEEQARIRYKIRRKKWLRDRRDLQSLRARAPETSRARKWQGR